MVLGVFAAISTEIEDLAPFRKLKELEIPVVFFDRVPLADGYDKVCLADEKAAQMAAEAIITEKKKSVLALFGHPHLSISRIRCASFKETFLKKSPGTKLHIDYPEGIVESKRLALVELKTKGKYDVVFCMGDLILIGVMHAIHELKLRVPDDISVISISNGLIPTMYNPRITYVETSGFKLGKLAYSQMLSCLKEQHEPEEVILESVLVKGGSL